MGNICGKQLEKSTSNHRNSNPVTFRVPASQRKLAQNRSVGHLSYRYADSVNKNPNPFIFEYVLDERVFAKLGNSEYRPCLHKTSNTHRLVKVVKKDKNDSDPANNISVFKEVFLLKQLDHPNILKLIEFFEEDLCYYIVFEEYLGYKFLDQVVLYKKLNEETIAFIIQQVLQTLNYMHKKSIIYRSLDAACLFCDDQNVIKLIDFSQAAHIEYEASQEVGVPYYMSPEMLKGNYDFKTDLWSAGVLTYFLLSGQMPFTGISKSKIRQAIMKGTYNLDTHDWDQISSEPKDMIKKLLEYDQLKRITATEALKHKWFNGLYNKPKESKIKSALVNMKKFQKNQVIVDVITLHLVNQSITSKEKFRLQQIFNDLDVNNDGKLSPEEITVGTYYINNRGFKKYFQADQSLSIEDIKKIMRNLDKNDNGFMDYTGIFNLLLEFMMACQDQQKILSEKKLSNFFDQLDKDKSGSLTREEIRILLGGNKITDLQWENIVKTSILNEKTELTRYEFILLVQQAITRTK